MLESLLSANLTDLTSLDLAGNDFYFRDLAFCEMTINLIERQTSLKLLKVGRIKNEE